MPKQLLIPLYMLVVVLLCGSLSGATWFARQQTVAQLRMLSLSNAPNGSMPIVPAVKGKSISRNQPTTPQPQTSSQPASEPPHPSALTIPLPKGDYPWHTDIIATVFWVGEAATADNDYIHNRTSAWMTDWVTAFGGTDNPNKRCGHFPCGFTPHENPFYFALPYGENTSSGLKASAKDIPWYTDKLAQKGLLLKNRWIEVRHDTNTAYAQWEDVGPYYSDDFAYVFGDTSPKSTRAGLDLSPATALYLEIGGKGLTHWRFVSEQDVPDGPWKSKVGGIPLVTSSVPHW